MNKFYDLAVFLVIGFCCTATVTARITNKYLPPNYAGLINPTEEGPAYFYKYTQNWPPRHQYQYQYLLGRAGSGGSGQSRKGGRNGGYYYNQNNNKNKVVPILRQSYNNDAKGNYNFSFLTGNGIQRNEIGEFKGTEAHGSQSVSGSYSYTGDDGHTYTVNYRADGNGFQATGDHLPTPPTLPTEM